MSHTKNGYLENYLLFSKTKYIHNNIQQNKIFCKKFQLKIYYRTENRLYKTGVWVIYGTTKLSQISHSIAGYLVFIPQIEAIILLVKQ